MVIGITSSIFCFGQRSELGFGLGTFNYTGDLVPTYNFKFSKPAATLFYRSNVSQAISLRVSATGGKLGANDLSPKDSFSAQRNASFNLFILEIGTVMEYHFLNWREQKRFIRFTPYLMGGLAVFGMSGNSSKTAPYSNVQAAIPFGLGAKYILNPKWYIALEFGARKTFFDYLDNISDSNKRVKNYQYGNPNDQDHYFFLGLSFTRTFYNIPCPRSPY